MYFTATPNTLAYIEWAGRARGGGNQPVGVLVKTRAATTAGGGLEALIASLYGSGGAEALHVSVRDDGSVSVYRDNSVGGPSTAISATGVAATGGDYWWWVDAPTAMLTGTNPTVYYDGAGSWDAVAMSGADSPAGTASDLNGMVQVIVNEDDGDGTGWGVGPLMVFQGVDRPTTPAAARAVAMAANPIAAAMAYTGCCFAFNGNSLVDVLSGAAGVNTDGMFDGALWDPARRLVAVRGLR